MQLLLIELERRPTGLMAENLRLAGFRLRRAGSIEAALASGLAPLNSAIILDLGRCGGPAPQLVERLRASGMTQPLVVISAVADWRSKVACLDAGADDVLFMPVRSEEVAARLRALVRREAGSATDRIAEGDLELDLKAQRAWLGGACLELTRTEFRLLRLLLLRPDEILTHDVIRDTLYLSDRKPSHNAIEVQVARLRRKVGSERIRTVRGAGYRYSASRGRMAITDPAYAQEAAPSVSDVDECPWATMQQWCPAV